MHFRDILVRPKDVGGGVDSGTTYAVSIAQSQQALLTALICEAEAKSLEDSAKQFRKMGVVDHTVGLRMAEAVRAAAREAGVEHDVIFEHPTALYGIGEVLADYARLRDLAVLGVSSPLGDEARLLTEALLFGSGRPLILVPEGSAFVGTGRLMIAWDATPAAVHAISGALPLLKAAKEVVITTVTDDKAFRPGRSGVELCRHLRRYAIEASFHPIQRFDRDIAEVLLEASAVQKADMLIMGGYAHSSLRGLIFGSATQGMFARPLPLPVLMAH